MSFISDIKRRYRLSSLPEMVPIAVKRPIKKIIHPGTDGYGVSYRNAKWMIDMTDCGVEEVDRHSHRLITSDTIRSAITYGTRGRKTEACIKRISDKNYYRFEHMLVIKDPFYQAPLTALAIFYTKKPYSVRYTVKGKTKEADFTRTLKPTKKHRVPIIGLYADYNNKVLIELLDDNGEVVNHRTIDIRMRALPGILLDLIKVGKHSGASAHPMTLITGGHEIRTLVFDEFGDIRYFTRRLTKAYGVFPISDGHMLYTEKWVDIPCFSVSQSCVMFDMDYLGRIHKTYLSSRGYHHCAIEKTLGGNIFIGSNTMDDHDEDAVMELDRVTGKPVRILNMRKYFEGSKFDEGSDWVHVNAVNYQADDDTLIVSMRNIHSVVKLDYKTEELKWVLSHPDNWEGTKVYDKVLKPVGDDMIWPFQQHASYQIEEDLDGNPDTIHVLLYDNHWARRVPVPCYDGDEAYSYLSIYTINEKEMTVSLYKTFKVDNSKIRSNAILEYDKRRIFNHAGDLYPEIDGQKGVIEEYDYDTGELINQYFVRTGFFTAYGFDPDIQSLADELQEDDNYVLGDTIPVEELAKRPDISSPKKLKEREPEEEEENLIVAEEAYPGQFKKKGIYKSTLKREIDVHFQEDLMLVKLVDHTVDYIYLLSDDKDYYMDLTKTYQTNKLFEGKIYEVPFWLKDIKSGKYHIYYKYNGEIYDSEEEFTIHD